MSLDTTGITMSAVHCALGVFITGITYSLPYCTLSDLVQVNSINKWSACKPIKHTGNVLADSYSALTGVMATSNYGFEFSDGTSGTPVCFGETEDEALTIASTGTA